MLFNVQRDRDGDINMSAADALARHGQAIRDSKGIFVGKLYL